MSSKTFVTLNKVNLGLAGLHAIQGIAVIALSRNFSLPVTTSFLTFNRATQTLDPATRTLFNLPIPLLVASFFFLSALAHLAIATVYRGRYEQNLVKGINKARWFEYSVSAGIMMVAIAMLVGVYDLSSLIMILSLVAGMNLMGLIMEIHNQTTNRTDWLSFEIGCFLGIIPWVVIAFAFWSSSFYGTGEIPTFVYWIYGSLFVFFNAFAVNMWLQYKRIGKWSDYLYGERAYMLLSLVAKSLLAWQIFAGTLRP